MTLGWAFTALIAANSFEIVPVSSVTFHRPATDTLMTLVTQRSVALSFGIACPGVFVGAGAAGWPSASGGSNASVPTRR